MTIVQTHVKGSGSKVVSETRVERKPDHIIGLRMLTGESIWIDTPAGEIRISTIDFQGRTRVEVYRGDAKSVKFRRV